LKILKNINDVTKGFFGGEFPSFCKHKKCHQHQTFFLKILQLFSSNFKNFNRFFQKNDIILQWV